MPMQYAEMKCGVLEQVLSGAVVAQGELEAVVTAIGENTFFGKTMTLLNAPQGKGHLQKVKQPSTLYGTTITTQQLSSLMPALCQ
jgi:magnesium-transporting ATPase (P-type)